MHYSLSNSTKTNHLPSSSPSNMALNFSHDLLLQTSSHQGQSSSLNSSNSGSSSSNNNSHHNTSSNHNNSSSNNSSSNNNDNNGNSSNNIISNNIVAELKHNPLTGSLDLDPTNSHQLMQTAAAGMNMWKSTMAAASFLPTPSDMNTFSNWTHGNGLSGHHQAAPSMTHHILDGQNLIAGYSQHNHHHHHHHNHHHQRPSTIQQLQSQQVDLVGASLKSHASGLAAEQASFMLNSINQQVQSANTSGGGGGAGGSGGGHHQSGSHQDSTAQLHLSRSQQQQIDHNTAATTSYNLSMNDNQFYTTQSHVNTIKSSVFLHDRSGAGSHSNHLGQLSYHNAAAAVAAAEHLNPQPGTSGHPLAGTSSSSGGGGSSSSKNIGNFRCPHCSEMFNMRNLYQSHLKSHSQEKGSKAKFHCELCGHSFSQKTSLNRHMKSHTGERPFPCEVCGKAFSEKERLKIHMRTHTGEKPFSCGICGKSFSQKSTVKRHQTVHTGEKKFKCDCGKGFANRGNLIAHIKTRGSNHFE